MNRLRLTTGPLAVFGAVFLVALVALLPMRLALGWIGIGGTGFAARDVRGSVWGGSVSEARYGGVALGDLRVGVSPVQLLVGRARVDLSGRGADPLHGAIGVSRHSVGLDDMTARLSAGDVFQPLPVSGLDLDDVSVRFQDGTCQKAEGRVKAVLSGDVAGLNLGQGMAGTVRCDAGALLLPLVSGSGNENVAVRLWSTGRYRAELAVQPGDPLIEAKLAASGFQPGPRGYTLAVEGKF